MRRLFTASALSLSLAMTGLVAQDQAEDVTDKYVDQADPDSAAFTDARTPQQEFDDWLVETGFSEGENEIGDQYILIGSGRAIVPAGKNFVRRRQAAFNSAILDAKAALAESLSAIVTSNRSLSIFEDAGNDIPLPGRRASETLSIMDKAQKLAGAKLDAELAKYYPNWNGSNLSDAEKRQQMITLQERYKENLSQHAHQFLMGAVPVINIEGVNSNGDFEVLVGLMWSAKTARAAQALTDDRVQLQKGAEAGTIRSQLQEALAEDPMFLAVSQGVRMWRNENGDRVIVSFAPIDRSRSIARNRQQAGLIGRTQIAQFVAEGVESTAVSQTDVANNTYASGEVDAVDSPIQVDVFAWTPIKREVADKDDKTKKTRRRSGRTRRGAAGIPD